MRHRDTWITGVDGLETATTDVNVRMTTEEVWTLTGEVREAE